MVKTCRNICHTYNVQSLQSKIKIPKCRRCEVVYLDWDGVWCPCCGERLATHSKHSVNNNRTVKRY